MNLRHGLLALLAAVLLVPATAQAAPEPGVVAALPFTARDLQNVKDLNAKTVRFFMYTNQDPTIFDDAVRQLATVGAKPLFVVLGDTSNPPTTDAQIRDYAAFLSSAVAHYKGQAAGWEVWNEPDGPRFWAGQPPFDASHTTRDASAYAKLLKAGHDAVKAADPGATVIAAGLTGNDASFLKSMYDNGAGNAFDVVAVHTDTACAIGSPYDYLRDGPGGPINQFSWLGLLTIHDVMSANGDADKPVWLTEIGWSSYEGTCRDGAGAGTKPAGVGEANQATYLLEAMHCARVHDMTWLQKAILFVLNEAPDPDPMNTGYGAVRQDGGHKPVYDAWKGYAASGDQIPDSEACGDFTPPSIHVAQPTTGAQFVGALPISVSAQDPAGVPRIALAVDGATQIRNFTDGKSPTMLTGSLTWQGAKKLSLGPHKLTVAAIDVHGNLATSVVNVVKVDPSKLKAIKTKIVAKLSGKGGRRTVSIRVAPSAVGLTHLLGKIDVVAQKRRGKKWVSAHRYSKSAKGSDKKALTFKLKLAKAQWRIVIRYRPKAKTGYMGTTRVLASFRV